MKDGKVTIDDFGIISFEVGAESGKTHRFDKHVNDDYIFVTTYSKKGSVIAKLVMDTRKPSNKNALDEFNNHVMENYIDENQ